MRTRMRCFPGNAAWKKGPTRFLTSRAKATVFQGWVHNTNRSLPVLVVKPRTLPFLTPRLYSRRVNICRGFGFWNSAFAFSLAFMYVQEQR